MKKFLQKYDKFEEYLLIGSLVFNVLLIFSQIFMRTIFNYSLSWTEELSRYIFIWQTWLGTSIALKYKQHIRVEILINIFKKAKNKKILEISVNLIWIAFSIFLLYAGTLLCKSMIARNVLSSGMRISLVFVYSCLPISSLIVLIRLINDSINLIKREK
jgi:possible C4-dicarboxylater TRAP-T family tripartite ATP-independent periplasmic transporter membrane protein, small subunit